MTATLPPIPATAPVTTPEVPAQQYQNWFITGFTAPGITPTSCPVTVVFTRSGTDSNGNTILMSGPGSSFTLQVDAFQQTTNTSIQTAMGAVIEAAVALAQAQGLL